MEEQEILSKLCIYDLRNPSFSIPYPEDEPREPRKDCFCDNCFYGRDDLAMEILRLKGE